MAGISKKIESFFNKKRVKESPSFMRNGGAVMEKLIYLSNARNEIHVRRFTTKEITESTNSFNELVRHCGHYKLFKANLDGRPVLVLIWEESRAGYYSVEFSIAISALTSHLKYMLKLIGYCPDYVYAALVYEYAETKTLSDYLHEGRNNITLSWGNRIKIARDLAGMLVYLHTCFPQSIIHRDLNPSYVFIDKNGEAKLFDFSSAVEIPEGESVLVNRIEGTSWFIEPEYAFSGLVTTKTDVYAFGMLLLMLLAGNRHPFSLNEEMMLMREFSEKLIDHNILQEVGIDEFQAIAELTLSCIHAKADHRPEMTSVARSLHEIEKAVRKTSCRIVSSFEDNQIAMRKKLMVLSSGRYKDIPFHIFSSGEIINGTDNFQEHLVGDTYYGVFKGYLDGCRVLIKKREVLEVSSLGFLRHAAIVEAAICSLMSDLKHVPKLLGCCLEFKIPCLVFEDVESTMTLYETLYSKNHNKLLSWSHRLKIANDIAAVMSHLHTSFPTPIIHRDLKPSNVIISQNGEAKLVEFSFAVALPPEESQVKDNFIFGTWGSLDPDYMRSKFVSTKTDVYSFGVLLLVLLTGRNAFWVNSEGVLINIMTFVDEVIGESQIDNLVDPRILQGIEMTEFEPVLDIARQCTRIRGEDRPEMIEVARLLYQIETDASRVTLNQ